MKYLVMTSLVFLATASMAGEAGKTDTGLQYNYLEVDYSTATVSSKAYTGYYTSGSFLINENIYALANMASYTKSGSSAYDKTNIGIGYRMPIAPAADLQTS